MAVAVRGAAVRAAAQCDVNEEEEEEESEG